MGCHVVKSFVSVNSQQYYRNSPDAMDNNKDAGAGGDTQPQTQSQSTNAWTNMDSQPIEQVVWGRLYPKSVKVNSLDLCNTQFAAGRDEGNDLCLSRRELPEKILCRTSKVHFQITKDLSDVTNPVYIEDLSRNGTFLNGEPIGHKKRQILLNDDIISMSHPQYKAFVYKDLSPNEAHGLPKKICARYHIGRKLGAGACGVVRLVYDRRTCDAFAMKHIKKNQLMSTMSSADAHRVANEGQIMRSLQHPCVVAMHDIIESADSVFIVLELMQGGDLLSRIIGRKRLSERTAKLYFVQLCQAVKYLHDKNITHRDLKPDNVLLQTNEEETLLKVSDFGLSKALADDSVMRTLCGTPLYVAPEVLLTGGRGSYTSKVDIWSMGVVLFTCLSGTLPFSDEYGTPACDQIKKGAFAYRSPVWRSVSASAKKLIESMLTVCSDKRPTIDEVLQNVWLQDEEILRKAESIMRVPLIGLVKQPVATTQPAPEMRSRPTAKQTVRMDVMAVDGGGTTCTEDDPLNKMPNVEEQENMSANFLQPPAAKRRRIEQM